MKPLKVVALNQKTRDLVEATFSKDKIYEKTYKMEDEMEDLHSELCNITKKLEEDIVEQYKKEMWEAQREYKEFTEKQNEHDLLKKLEQKKNEILNERESLLQYTFNISLEMKTCKDRLKKVQSESAELDEEIRFLLQQIQFADQQHDKLEDRIDTLREDLNKIDPSLEILKEASLLKI